MEFAGPVLISLTRSKRQTFYRLAGPRSDLSCHHVMIACAIGGGSPFEAGSCRTVTPRGCSCRPAVIRLVLPVMRQQRPDGSRVPVRQRHRSSAPCTWNTFFARSIPIVVSFISVAPFVQVVVSQLHFGTSMPFQRGATIPLVSAGRRSRPAVAAV